MRVARTPGHGEKRKEAFERKCDALKGLKALRKKEISAYRSKREDWEPGKGVGVRQSKKKWGRGTL